jgi:hypothetical protein
MVLLTHRDLSDDRQMFRKDLLVTFRNWLNRFWLLLNDDLLFTSEGLSWGLISDGLAVDSLHFGFFLGFHNYVCRLVSTLIKHS